MMALLLGVLLLLIAVLAYDGWNIARSRWVARRMRRPVRKAVPVIDRRQRRAGGRRRSDLHRSS